MGRPIKKKFFGPTNSPNRNPPETSNALSFGIKITAYLPASGETGYISGAGGSSAVASTIRRQVGSKKYICTNAQGVGRVRLSNNASPAKGFAYLVGYVAGTGAAENESSSGGTAVAIKKLTAHHAYGYNGHVYKWTAQNDSTMDYIELTLIM